MIIYKPELTSKDNEIIISVRVEFKNTKIAVPSRLWFKFPTSYRDYITDRTDGFVVGLLPVAMILGESIEVEGTMSQRLAHGIQEYQQVLKVWWPEQFNTIDLKYKSFEEKNHIIQKQGTGCSFSGGVDSFYSLWRHLPENEPIPKYRITHCLLINGFDKDVDLDYTGNFNRVMQVYESMAQELGINLVVSCNNLQKFRLAVIDERDLYHSFGSAISASILVLGNLFSRFYLAGSHTYEYDRLIPEGSHPVLDHLLSTESLEIIHDGANASRAQKTAVIASWPVTYYRLRVCFNKTIFNTKTEIIENCCRCEKCIRTMTSLYLLKALPDYKTFPVPLNFRSISRAGFISKGFRLFCKENIRLATKTKNRRMALLLYYASLKGFLIENTVRPVYQKFKAILYRQH